MEKAAIVQLKPCQHTCLCKKCYKELQDRDEIECPICRIPTLSYYFVPKNLVWNPISIDQYHQQGQMCAQQQLNELNSYVTQHPEIVDKLNPCTQEIFKQNALQGHSLYQYNYKNGNNNNQKGIVATTTTSTDVHTSLFENHRMRSEQLSLTSCLNLAATTSSSTSQIDSAAENTP